MFKAFRRHMKKPVSPSFVLRSLTYLSFIAALILLPPTHPTSLSRRESFKELLLHLRGCHWQSGAALVRFFLFFRTGAALDGWDSQLTVPRRRTSPASEVATGKVALHRSGFYFFSGLVQHSAVGTVI